MTDDPFAQAARAEAERQFPAPLYDTAWSQNEVQIKRALWESGAEWARDYYVAHMPQVTIRYEENNPSVCEVRRDGVLIFSGRDHSADLRVAAQEPTDAEVLAALNAHDPTVSTPNLGHYAPSHVEAMRAALNAARNATA